MRLQHWIVAAAVSVAVPAVAAAQTSTSAGQPGTTTATPGTTGQTGDTTGTTAGQPGTTTGTTAGQPATTTAGDEHNGLLGTSESHWIASGFVGSNFGAQANNSSVDFGGSVGYLWNNWIGGEFMAGFSPNFNMQPTPNNAVLLGTTPSINSYMVNAIGALPLGGGANWQPFVSGGFGAITLRSDLSTLGSGNNAIGNAFNPDDSRFGGNIGAGVMGFAGAWGFRADVRYFRAFNTSTTTVTGTTPGGTSENVFSNILPGLDFWRANIGVAVRF